MNERFFANCRLLKDALSTMNDEFSIVILIGDDMYEMGDVTVEQCINPNNKMEKVVCLNIVMSSLKQ